VPATGRPSRRQRQVARPADVEALPGPPPDEPVQVWAWIDQTAGHVRARQFKPSEGMAEDEACGSAD
jgi:predicted PhzF superfamily epimerase YddE/YHI9